MEEDEILLVVGEIIHMSAVNVDEYFFEMYSHLYTGEDLNTVAVYIGNVANGNIQSTACTQDEAQAWVDRGCG